MNRTYRVPDISCDHCRHAIERALRDVTGVDHVAVDLERRVVTVAGEPDDDLVHSSIKGAGYRVAGVRLT